MHASTKARFGVAAVALSLAALLGACGASGGDTTESGEGSTTTETTEPVDEATTTTEADETTTTVTDDTTTTTENNEGTDTETTELDTLDDGDHYGFIAGTENGKVEGQDVQVLLWDEVEFLTGQEAIDAAAEDNYQLDTDYYVRNNNQTIRRIAVVPDAEVYSLNEGSPDPVVASVDEVADDEFLFKINVGNVRDITTISSIEAVYLP